MDIYTFRILAVGLIVVLAGMWAFFHFKNKGNNNPAKKLAKGSRDHRRRVMDNHSMEPLFEELLSDSPQKNIPAPESVRPKGSDAAEQEDEASEPAQASAAPPSIVDRIASFFKQEPAAMDEEAEAEQQAAESKKAERKERVLVSLVLRANKREGFNIPRLLTSLEENDMVFGEMDIFHRVDKSRGEDVHSFSVINGEEPGTLIPEELQKSGTSTIKFFISLNDCHQPLKSFSEMVRFAQSLTMRLDAKLYDNQGGQLSVQNIEYQRDIIKKYIHNRMLASSQKNA